MNDLALLRCLRLARARGVGPRTARLLLERLGSLEALDRLSAAGLQAHGVPARIARAVCDPALPARARAELAELRAAGAHVLGWGVAGYPPALEDLADPPLTLGVLGCQLTPGRAIGVVGARRATPGGQEIARELGYELARAGVTVISGLARGVDRAAHEGALAAGGRTLAVLGSGLLEVYPPQHQALAERIARQGGGVLSELEPRAQPSRHSFPRRNRVIAALAQGLVVVEAGARSGALISADFALQCGREVMAVPGSILEPLSRGCNALIKDGAHLVESADDVIEITFGVAPREPRAECAGSPGDAERRRPPARTSNEPADPPLPSFLL
jgi:DNA processing protein